MLPFRAQLPDVYGSYTILFSLIRENKDTNKWNVFSYGKLCSRENEWVTRGYSCLLLIASGNGKLCQKREMLGSCSRPAGRQAHQLMTAAFFFFYTNYTESCFRWWLNTQRSLCRFYLSSWTPWEQSPTRKSSTFFRQNTGSFILKCCSSYLELIRVPHVPSKASQTGLAHCRWRALFSLACPSGRLKTYCPPNTTKHLVLCIKGLISDFSYWVVLLLQGRTSHHNHCA